MSMNCQADMLSSSTVQRGYAATTGHYAGAASLHLFISRGGGLHQVRALRETGQGGVALLWHGMHREFREFVPFPKGGAAA